VDYQFVKRTVSVAEFSAGLIQNLGGAGRVVNKVIIATESSDLGADFSQSLMNRYHSKGPSFDANSVGQVTLNLKYNDNFLYPIDVKNVARQYHNVFSAEGRVPYITRDLYRGEGQLARNHATVKGSVSFENYSAKDELANHQFYTAYRLNKGERVNSRGIELYDTRHQMGDSCTLRAYLQVVKIATLRDGVFESMFA